MKVLIATPYFHPRTGGLETYAWHLVHGLLARGVEAVVVCGDDVASPTRGELDGLPVYRLPIWRTAFNTPLHPAWPRWLRRIIAVERPDVVNAHMPVVFMGDTAALAAGRRPFVVTYHAATLVRPGGFMLRALTGAYLLVQRATLWRADAIVAVSPYVRQVLVRRFPQWRDKVHVVSNAVPAVGPPVTTAGEGLLFIASLKPTHNWKGLPLVLEALARYRDRYGAPPRLTVLGDGEDRQRYQRLAAGLHLEHVVDFVGQVPPGQRDTLLRRSRALVAYPTTANDAFPTVLLDAWAQGVPVVAAAIGALPSLVRDGSTGLLARPHDPTHLADVLHTVVAEPGRAMAMGSRGRAMVAQEYTWPVQVTRMLDVLQAVTRL